MGQTFSQTDTHTTATELEHVTMDMEQLTEDFVKRQDDEIKLNKLLNQKLNELEQETKEQFQEQLKASLTLVVPDDKPNLNSRDLDAKIITSNEKISKLNRKAFDEPEMAAMKDKILKCLKDNKGKPLNCLELINEFKDLSSR